MGVYTIGLTLLGERFKGRDLASANATYVMLYAIGLLERTDGRRRRARRMESAWARWWFWRLISVFYVIFLMVRRQNEAASTA